MTESTITSQDGTHILYERHGSGPPLIMVHGGLVDRTFWGPSLPLDLCDGPPRARPQRSLSG